MRVEEAATRLLNYFGEGGEYQGDPEEDMKLVYDTLSGVGLVPIREEDAAAA
jgi:hypothetical protein